MTTEDLRDRVWRQAANGLDGDRLLATRHSRAKQLAKKLDRPPGKNGFRMYAAGCAHTIQNGKAKAARNAEAALVRAVCDWIDAVRAPDLQKLVDARLANPAPPPVRGN